MGSAPACSPASFSKGIPEAGSLQVLPTHPIARANAGWVQALMQRCFLVLSPCFRLACTHRDALMIPSGKHSSETGLGFQPKGQGTRGNSCGTAVTWRFATLLWCCLLNDVQTEAWGLPVLPPASIARLCSAPAKSFHHILEAVPIQKAFP